MGTLQDHSPGSGIFEIYFLLGFLLWSKTLLQCLDALKAFVYLTFNMFWLIFHFLPSHSHYSTLVGQNSMVWVTLLLPQVANHLIENPRSSCDAETTWPTPTLSNLLSVVSPFRRLLIPMTLSTSLAGISIWALSSLGTVSWMASLSLATRLWCALLLHPDTSLSCDGSSVNSGLPLSLNNWDLSP